MRLRRQLSAALLLFLTPTIVRAQDYPDYDGDSGRDGGLSYFTTPNRTTAISSFKYGTKFEVAWDTTALINGWSGWEGTTGGQKFIGITLNYWNPTANPPVFTIDVNLNLNSVAASKSPQTAAVISNTLSASAQFYLKGRLFVNGTDGATHEHFFTSQWFSMGQGDFESVQSSIYAPYITETSAATPSSTSDASSVVSSITSALPSSSTSSTPTPEKNITGPAVGGAIGGAAIIVLIAALFIFGRRKGWFGKQKQHAPNYAGPAEMGMPSPYMPQGAQGAGWMGPGGKFSNGQGPRGQAGSVGTKYPQGNPEYYPVPNSQFAQELDGREQHPAAVEASAVGRGRN